MNVVRLDHLVLTVKNVAATCAFYTKVLGMEEITFSGGRKALTFGEQKINLHQQGHEVDPKAAKPTPGSADLCFLTADKIPSVIQHLKDCGVPIILGPVERIGAIMAIESVYFRDPDDNLIEVSILKKTG